MSTLASFELATPARVVFGAGRLAGVAAEVEGLGTRRVLLVTGRGGDRFALGARLAQRGIATIPFTAPGEPTVDEARAGAALALAEGCAGVVAIGGGSALDLGKAVAALAANGGEPLEFLEVAGRGRLLSRPSLPFVAIPTTAGTGSEVTRNAVLSLPEARVKASLRSPLMLARLAVVDPELLAGLSPAVLAASGLDAFVQLVEPWLSARANPFTDALAREGIARSVRSLRRACLEGADAAAREDLAVASLFGGLCLANGGLGAVHGLAGPAGGLLGAPHGALCAALLVPCLEVNLSALRARSPGHPAVARLGELAGWLTGRPGAAAEDGVAWIAELCRALGVQGLARHGMTAGHVADLVTAAKAASSMRGNPIVLTDGELAEIAGRAL